MGLEVGVVGVLAGETAHDMGDRDGREGGGHEREPEKSGVEVGSDLSFGLAALEVTEILALHAVRRGMIV